MVNCVLLLNNGDIEDLSVPLKSSQLAKPITKLITDAMGKKLIKSIGKGKIKKVHSWSIDDYYLFAFGYLSGNNENSHELPPPFDQKCYGDILMFKVNTKEQVIDMTSEDYETIYGNLFESGETVNSDDNDSEISYEDQENVENLSDVESDVEDEYDDETSDEEDIEDTDNEQLIDEKDDEWEADDDAIEDNVEHEVRVKNKELINNILNNTELTNRVELSIYNFTLSVCDKKKVPKRWDNPVFKKIYINKSRSLYSNIKADSYIGNENLKQKLVESKIDTDNIANLTYQELFPEHWKKLLDEKYRRDKSIYEDTAEAMTDQFKCGRCKSRKCVYYEMQTRSADEGMTVFITCLNCGNRWKQ